MYRKKSFSDDNEAILYLVATPIGNLEDMTYRAINILKSVDIIYAEDTRNSRVLLNHYDIKTKLESYHEFNQMVKTQEVIDVLKSGSSVAVITDAGLPVISDPGYRIVREAINEGIAVSTIPGASAGISALIASGHDPKPYMFYGFLDSKQSVRIKELNELKYLKQTMIFYEAPHRIVETVMDMYNVFGNRYATIHRELTKKHEEFISFNLGEYEELNSIKGEMVLIVEGYKEEDTSFDPNLKIVELINLGYKPNEAIKEVAKMLNVSKNEVYKNYVKFREEND